MYSTIMLLTCYVEVFRSTSTNIYQNKKTENVALDVLHIVRALNDSNRRSAIMSTLVVHRNWQIVWLRNRPVSQNNLTPHIDDDDEYENVYGAITQHMPLQGRYTCVTRVTKRTHRMSEI